MAASSLTPSTRLGAPATAEEANRLAERHLARRMVVWTLIMIPIGIAVLSTVVAIAMRNSGVAIAPPIATGAGIGVLAGLVAGMWAGFLANNSEFEELERTRRRTHTS